MNRNLAEFEAKGVESKTASSVEFPNWFVLFLALFSIYLVLPLYDVPLFGLSISAPIFLFLAWHIYMGSKTGWVKQYRGWFLLAFFIWLGIAIAALANGIRSGGTDISASTYISLLRFADWLLVFVSIAYLASLPGMLERLGAWLGWSVMVLGLLRLGEYFFGGVLIGSGLSPQFFTQNFYGIEFSIFTPFAYLLVFKAQGWKKAIAVLGVLVLAAAVAVNGSRGSWVAIASGLLVLLVFTFFRKPGYAFGLLILMSLLMFTAYRVYSADPSRYQPVLNRFTTLQKVEEDKSYATRLWLNAKSMAIFQNSPAIGVGTGRYTMAYVEVPLPAVISYHNYGRMNQITSHNSYLSFLAENGLVGAMPYGILLVTLTVIGLRSAWGGLAKNEVLPIFIFVAFLQMSIHFWVMSGLTGTVTWYMYGLVAGLEKR